MLVGALLGSVPSAAVPAPDQAQVTTFTVTKTADTGDGRCDSDCSLREAITAANGTTGARVSIPAQTSAYTLSSGELLITANMTIEGAGAASTIIDGGGNVRVFRIGETITDSRGGITRQTCTITTTISVTISGVTIQNGNSGSGRAGGIYADGCTLTVSKSVIKNNTGGSGAGIYVAGRVDNSVAGSTTIVNRPVTVSQSTITGNATTPSSSGKGGGIFNASGVLHVVNSTLVDNTAGTSGTAIGNTGTAVVVGSTISGNQYSQSLIVSEGDGASFSFTNSILTNGANPASNGPVCASTDTNFSSGGSNLTRGGTCGLGAAGDRDADALLGALADNGGPTPTMAPGSGSVAISGGSGQACTGLPALSMGGIDQRGVTRPSTSCDIGAVQRTAAPVLTAATPHFASTGAAATTLTVAGSNFTPISVVRWNGADRPTTFDNASQLRVTISATDLAPTSTPTTASLTVSTPAPGGGASAAVPFTIVSANTGAVQSVIAAANATVTASVPSTTSAPGVSATLTNSGSSSATLTTVSFTSDPVDNDSALPGVFAAAASFVDLRVTGAGASASMTASFYYPSPATGTDETTLALEYHTGSEWAPVLSSGGAQPGKNTSDNLDGTVSGGRFTVTFDATSTPTLASLTGTFFGMVSPPARVTNTTDTGVGDGNCSPGNCSLRQAITAANAANDGRIVSVPAGTYALTNGELTVTGNMTIRGAGANATTINAAGASRVFNVSSGTVTIAGLTATRGNGNVAATTRPARAGGGIFNNATLTLIGSTVSGSAADYGGGIYNVASLTVVNSTIYQNTSRQGLGGGITNNRGTVTVTTSTIKGNYSPNGSGTSGGGGIVVGGGTVSVTGSTFEGNVAGSDGGGVYVYAGGTLVVANSTLSGNKSSNRGGAIAVGAGTGTVINSTFDGNDGFGGALYASGPGSLTVTNSILAGSTLGGQVFDNCRTQSGGVISSGGWNLSSDGSCGGGQNDQLNTDPKLGPLQVNAPGTTETLAPASDSPAIGAGSPTVCAAAPVSGVDQRGVARPTGACDVGAIQSSANR